jgi:hypothetical protein
MCVNIESSQQPKNLDNELIEKKTFLNKKKRELYKQFQNYGL